MTFLVKGEKRLSPPTFLNLNFVLLCSPRITCSFWDLPILAACYPTAVQRTPGNPFPDLRFATAMLWKTWKLFWLSLGIPTCELVSILPKGGVHHMQLTVAWPKMICKDLGAGKVRPWRLGMLIFLWVNAFPSPSQCWNVSDSLCCFVLLSPCFPKTPFGSVMWQISCGKL